MSLEPPKQLNTDGTVSEPKRRRSDAGKPRGRNRRRYFADPNQLQLDFTKKADRQQVKQDITKIVKQPVKRALVPAVKKTGKGIVGLLKQMKNDPLTTAVGAGVARDSFRLPPLPQAPKVSGGKVGRRTAG